MFKHLTRIATLSVIAGAVILPSAAHAGTGTWTYSDNDDDDCWDLAEMDTDGNGRSDAFWVDLDNDCRFEVYVWNSVGDDSFFESMIVDEDGDGYWDTWFADNDGLEGFDLVYYDDNADGIADRSANLTNANNTNAFNPNPMVPSPSSTNSMITLYDQAFGIDDPITRAWTLGQLNLITAQQNHMVDVWFW